MTDGSDYITETITKAVTSGSTRHYVNDPSEAPEGVQVHEGEQGGLYWVTGEEGSADGEDGDEEPGDIPPHEMFNGEEGEPWTWDRPDPEELDAWIDGVQATPEWSTGAEAFQKAWQGGHNTASEHSTTTEEGETQWDPERVENVHDPAVEEHLNEDAASDEPVGVILLGPPGAGKGWWEEKVEEGVYGDQFDREFTRINSDDTKPDVPEYDGTNASYVHDEASHISKNRIAPEAIERQHNVFYDSVAASPEGTMRLVEEMEEAGYDMRAVFVDVPEEKSCYNVVQRYEDEGRFTPLDYVKNARDGSSETFRQVAERIGEDKIGYFNNDVEWGEPPEQVVQGDDLFKILFGPDSSIFNTLAKQFLNGEHNG